MVGEWRTFFNFLRLQKTYGRCWIYSSCSEYGTRVVVRAISVTLGSKEYENGDKHRLEKNTETELGNKECAACT